MSSEIQFDLAQYYPMKATFERILGGDSYRKLKDYATIKDWKVETKKLLQSIQLSIDATIEIADDEWRQEINEEIEYGVKLVNRCKTIDELFSSLSAVLIKIVFLQIGKIPTGHYLQNKVILKESNWRLNTFRSVQYVQNSHQKENQKKCLSKK